MQEYYIGVEPEPFSNTEKVPEHEFQNRDEIELSILTKEGRWVDLRGFFYAKDEKGDFVLNERGEKLMVRKIWVPVWRMKQWLRCKDYLMFIIYELFPNDLLFLLQIDFRSSPEAAHKLVNVFDSIYDHFSFIMRETLGVTDAEFASMESHLYLEDFIAIFCATIEDSVIDDRLELILKKTRDALAQRFTLEKVWPNLPDIMEQLQEQFSRPTP